MYIHVQGTSFYLHNVCKYCYLHIEYFSFQTGNKMDESFEHSLVPYTFEACMDSKGRNRKKVYVCDLKQSRMGYASFKM